MRKIWKLEEFGLSVITFQLRRDFSPTEVAKGNGRIHHMYYCSVNMLQHLQYYNEAPSVVKSCPVQEKEAGFENHFLKEGGVGETLTPTTA